MTHLDAEAGGQTLFDVTWEGTLFKTWEQQPEAFKEDLRRKAVAITIATMAEDDPDTYRGADPSNEGPLPHPMDPDIKDPEDPLAH